MARQSYIFSFAAEGGRSRRIQWERLGDNMEATFELAKKAALKDYPKASGFSIASTEGRGTDEEWRAGRARDALHWLDRNLKTRSSPKQKERSMSPPSASASNPKRQKYYFSFSPRKGPCRRVGWVREGGSMEKVFKYAKKAALRAHPEATGFSLQHYSSAHRLGIDPNAGRKYISLSGGHKDPFSIAFRGRVAATIRKVGAQAQTVVRSLYGPTPTDAEEQDALNALWDITQGSGMSLRYWIDAAGGEPNPKKSKRKAKRKVKARKTKAKKARSRFGLGTLLGVVAVGAMAIGAANRKA